MIRALLLLAAMVLLGAAGEDFPVPTDKNLIFYVQRSLNSNTIVYTARIGDDGKGIDRDRVFAKAVEKGLIAPDFLIDKAITSALGQVAKTADSVADLPASAEFVLDVPANVPVSHPYWLREEPTAGMFRVADPKLIGTPENAPPG